MIVNIVNSFQHGGDGRAASVFQDALDHSESGGVQARPGSETGGRDEPQSILHQLNEPIEGGGAETGRAPYPAAREKKDKEKQL